ncbi:hypothetical protein B1L11_42005 [Microbispora sp. GKU 823]|nr:hypothetical protein B1L11_42005 [Microbispora sp. GKU 823]
MPKSRLSGTRTRRRRHLVLSSGVTARDPPSSIRPASGRHCPAYGEVASAVVADPDLIGLIDGLPGMERHPNLVLAAAGFLGGPREDASRLPRWCVRHWDSLRETILTHRVQTDEAGRCASLLPVLASLPQPSPSSRSAPPPGCASPPTATAMTICRPSGSWTAPSS